ncbi:MAG: DNA polymerase IV [Patescibacteria group bacterium]
MNATSTAGSSSDYPRAIIHVDGDAFFASCEVAKNLSLRGKPMVVGGSRGIAVALTYEAKRLGVTRGMPVYQIKKMFPDVVILPGDYDLYEMFARRMYAIVRRYTPVVEEYSVDECFADITDMQTVLKKTYEEIAASIKESLESELGISFSVGLAVTKVLAKVASKYQKPSGLVCIRENTEREYLERVSVGSIWGIGRATAQFLYKNKIETALQFIDQPEWWVVEHMARPHQKLWTELRGTSLYVVDPESSDLQKSIASTRTFRPPTTDKSFIFSQLSKNIETACARARSHGLIAKRALCFLKSQEFQYRRFEIELVNHTNIPSQILAGVGSAFEKNFRPQVLYRATGVTLSNVREDTIQQGDLFENTERRISETNVYEVIDTLEHKFGKHTIFLASSGQSFGRNRRRRMIGIPYLGTV